MALSIIGTPAAGTGTTITLPTHASGDLIVLFAYKDGATSVPTKPSAGGNVPTWVDIDAPTGANSNAAYCAYAVATGSTHTSGTWTGATGMAAIVLRGQGGSPIGGHAQSGAQASGSATAPAVTLTDSSGSSMLLHFYGHRTVTAWSAAPANYTRRASVATETCLNTKNSSTTDGSIAQPCTSTNSGYRGQTVEILVPATLTGAADTASAVTLDASGRNATTAAADTTVTVALDVDSVVVPGAPTTTQTGIARLSLNAGNEPYVRTGHIIHVRARVTGGTATLRVQLYEGATPITAELETDALTGTLADYTLNVPDADAASIGSYTNLELRVYGYSAAGDTATVEVADLELRVPGSVGPITVFGAADHAAATALDAAGRKTANSAADTTTTIALDAAGRRTRLGVADTTIATTLDTVGRKTAKAVADTAPAVTLDVAARRVVKGAADTTVAVALDTAARNQSRGHVDTSRAVALDVAARNHARAHVDHAVPVSLDAIGDVEGVAAGHVDHAATVQLDAAARNATRAQADHTASVALDLAARAQARATADTTLTTTLDAAGRNQARAAADTTVTPSLDVAARNATRAAADTTATVELAVAGAAEGMVTGQADLAIAASLDAAGRQHARAAADTTIAVSLEATGEAEGAVTGQADHTTSTELAAQGRATVRAHADLTVTTQLDATGRKTAKGAADTTVATTLDTLGRRVRVAHADITIATSVDTSGRQTSRGHIAYTPTTSLDLNGRQTSRGHVATTCTVALAVDGFGFAGVVAHISLDITLQFLVANIHGTSTLTHHGATRTSTRTRVLSPEYANEHPAATIQSSEEPDAAQALTTRRTAGVATVERTP